MEGPSALGGGEVGWAQPPQLVAHELCPSRVGIQNAGNSRTHTRALQLQAPPWPPVLARPI